MCDATYDATEQAAIVQNFGCQFCVCVSRWAGGQVGRWALWRSVLLTFPLSHFPTRNSVRSNGPEPQRVDRGNRPRAHRKNVTNNAAHACGRALKGFNSARMVVRLDLERDGQAVADIDDPRVFLAGPNENLGRPRRECFQERAGILVGTMLAPHYRENAKFGIGRFAAENFFDLGVL